MIKKKIKRSPLTTGGYRAHVTIVLAEINKTKYGSKAYLIQISASNTPTKRRPEQASFRLYRRWCVVVQQALVFLSILIVCLNNQKLVLFSSTFDDGV